MLVSGLDDNHLIRKFPIGFSLQLMLKCTDVLMVPL